MTFNILPRGARLFLLCSLLAAVPLGTAQANSSPLMTDDPPTLIQHLRSELQQKDPVRREYALMDVIALANCPTSCTLSLNSVQGKQIKIENNDGAGSVVDLTALLPALLDTYRKGPADGYRLMALSALVRIGDEKTLERLASERGTQSKAMSEQTSRSLAAFYLAKYPELEKGLSRTGRLSVRDVEKAKAVRVRLARKAAAQNK